MNMNVPLRKNLHHRLYDINAEQKMKGLKMTEVMLEKLRNAVSTDGYKNMAIKTMIPKTTLWRICTKGLIPTPGHNKLIQMWYENSVGKNEPAATAEKKETTGRGKKQAVSLNRIRKCRLDEMETLRQNIMEKISCIESYSSLLTLDLILTANKPVTITIHSYPPVIEAVKKGSFLTMLRQSLALFFCGASAGALITCTLFAILR